MHRGNILGYDVRAQVQVDTSGISKCLTNPAMIRQKKWASASVIRGI